VKDNIDATDLATVAIHINFPPVADLTAPAVFGDAPFGVDFDASGTIDPDGSIVSYEWDWTNDGTYDDNSGTDATESHTYSSPGKFTCKVRVTDDDGLVSTATLLVDSNAAPTASINNQGANGTDAPRYVTFLGNGSGEPGGSIAQYAWDWTNDGSYDYTSPSYSATHTFPTGGTYTTKLRVTDDDGQQATATSTFTLTRAIVWSNQAYALQRSHWTYGTYLTIASLNSKPIIAYNSGFSSIGFAFGQATGADPLQTSSWTGYYVAGKYDAWNGAPDIDVMVAQAGQPRPCVAWVAPDPQGVDGDQDGLYFSRALSAMPATAADWITYRIENGYHDTGYNPSLEILGPLTNCKPMVSFYDEGAHELRFTRATSSTPQGPGDWNRSTIDSSGDVGRYSCLAIVGGVPAVVFYDTTNDDIKYAFANDATPSDSGDWTEYTVSPVGGGSNLCLREINGLPVISWYDQTQGDLEYARGLVAEPDTMTEWKFISVDTSGDVGSYPSLQSYEGRPLIVYYDRTNNKRKYAWATSNAPQSSADWIVRNLPGSTTDRKMPITVSGSDIYGVYYYITSTDGTGTSWVRIQKGNAP
jgi:PKD repeat protein